MTEPGDTSAERPGATVAETPPAEAVRRGRRELAVAVAVVVLGSGVALLASGRSAGTTPGVPAAPGTGGGAGARALALVAVAAAGALLLVRNRTRVVLGVALLAVGAGLVTMGVTPTRWSALVAGLLVAVGGAVVVVRARRWPQPRGRYDAPPPRRTGTPRDTWDALDRGEDPTA